VDVEDGDKLASSNISNINFSTHIITTSSGIRTGEIVSCQTKICSDGHKQYHDGFYFAK
jgi:hypothetical protein